MLEFVYIKQESLSGKVDTKKYKYHPAGDVIGAIVFSPYNNKPSYLLMGNDSQRNATISEMVAMLEVISQRFSSVSTHNSSVVLSGT
jgi:hypothetical protein